MFHALATRINTIYVIFWHILWLNPPPPPSSLPPPPSPLPGWVASLSQGYPQQYVAGTHFYTWVKRDNVEQSFLV